MARRGRRTAQATALQEAEFYRHPEAESPLRPDVGTQSQFKKRSRLLPTATTHHFRQRLLGMVKTQFGS